MDREIEDLASEMLDPLELILECEGLDTEGGCPQGTSLDAYFAAFKAAR